MRKQTEHDSESARHSSLAELKQVQHLVAEAHREMDRLAGTAR